MSKRDDNNPTYIKNVSFVTRRLIEGPKGQFLDIIGRHFNVSIAANSSTEHQLKMRGTAANVRPAKAFVREFDQLAANYANEHETPMANTKQVQAREWDHMRVELEHLLKGIKPHKQTNPRAGYVVDEDLRKAHPDVFEQAAGGQRVSKPANDQPRPKKPIKLEGQFKPRNENQAISYLAIKDPETTLVFLAGPAGGGKSHVPLRAAMEMYNEGQTEGIIIFRPRTVTGKKDFGAIGGGVAEKSAPYISALNDTTRSITGGAGLDNLKEVISTRTPDFARGATFTRIVIIDEAQNLSVSEATMLATRFGNGAKFIFNGDISNNQNDMTGEYPGLAHLIATQASGVVRGDKALERGTAFVAFTEDDSAARHHLLPHVQRALNSPDPEYAALMTTIRGARRDFALASAIEKATDYARQQLDKAADLTYGRYYKEALATFPSVFPDVGANVRPIRSGLRIA